MDSSVYSISSRLMLMHMYVGNILSCSTVFLKYIWRDCLSFILWIIIHFQWENPQGRMSGPTSQALVFEGIQIQIFVLADVWNWDLDLYFKQSRTSDVSTSTTWVWVVIVPNCKHNFTGAISELKRRSTKHYQNQLLGGCY